MRHRIIRRGMPYGARGSDDSGLAFVCFSSSIADGFEFIQRTWCNTGWRLASAPSVTCFSNRAIRGAHRHGHSKPGQRDSRMRPPEQPLVTVRGCEYLFVPSRRGFEWLTNL